MKGPSLHYDLRVLRVFCCDACGRKVQTAGSVTSHTCVCSDPPKFMRPLDRPRTVSPDVTPFISPADPEDLIEEDIIDEVTHVPYVPPKPPAPARFANRRKLYDETAITPDSEAVTDNSSIEEEVSFGAGIEHESLEQPSPESETTKPRTDSGGRSENRRTKPAQTDRNSNDSRSQRQQGSDGRSRRDRSRNSNRQGSGNSQQSSPGRPPAAKLNPSESQSDETSASDKDQGESDGNAKTAGGDNGPRRRSRRRGRRRGPRPEGGGE